MEAKRVLEQVDEFFERHGASRFSTLKQTCYGGVKEDEEKIHDRAGYKDENGCFYVFPSVWNSEVCKGFNTNFVNSVLIKHGRLASDDRGKASKSKRINKQVKRFYHYQNEGEEEE